MIELTPLDVRKKRGDFRRVMRGFDPAEVDSFLELVAERMESLVKEVMTLKERAARLADQVREQGDREKAVQDALVTAQELRKDISGQAQREAELMKREAENEIERMLIDAELRAEELRSAAVELERRRRRFLRDFRQYLERELDEIEREQARHPLDEKPLELELSRATGAVGTGETGPVEGEADAPVEETAAEVRDETPPQAEGETPAAAHGAEDEGAVVAEPSGTTAEGPEPPVESAVDVDSLAPEEAEMAAEDGADPAAEHVSTRVPVRSEAGGDPGGAGG